MHPFWDLAIGPVIDAVQPRLAVEVGALNGETTQHMVERLGAGAELHVVDPLPNFDPGEHERRFPGRYVFHRDLSLNVLEHLPPAQLVLLDGDHNWYTVLQELRQVAAVTDAAGEPLPVVLMHDVLWPYGRRDLYYAPEQIPEEHRQPWSTRGMRPGKSRLLRHGGFNVGMCNALEEGGPRNGVMTGLEDFLAERDRPTRLVVLEGYFGLAIVAEHERLDRHPRLTAVLDHLEGPDGQRALVELLEGIRNQNAFYYSSIIDTRERQNARLAERLLEVLKAGLVDSIERPEPALGPPPGTPPPRRTLSVATLKGQGRLVRLELQALRARRDGRARGVRSDLDHLHSCLDAMAADDIAGDLVQCGVGRGATAAFLAGYVDARGWSGTTVWAVDEDPERSARGPSPAADRGAGLQATLTRHGLDPSVVRYRAGELPTAQEGESSAIALLHVDARRVPSALTTVEALHDRVAPGGLVVVHGADAATGDDLAALRDRLGGRAPNEAARGGRLSWRRPDGVPVPTVGSGAR